MNNSRAGFESSAELRIGADGRARVARPPTVQFNVGRAEVCPAGDPDR